MNTFAQLWRDSIAQRRAPSNADEWSGRIKESPTRFGPSQYSHDFLQLAQLKPGQSVFDMGSGAGTLAIPCAQAGHTVLAADFSQAMLEQLQRNAQAAGCPPHNPQTMHLSWNDNWHLAGLQENQFDVAFASRSIMTHDLEDSLSKLAWIAKERVCTTVTTGASPRIFMPLFHDLGLQAQANPDASFVYAIAIELGFEPEVRYIHSLRQDFFSSKEEAFASYRPMLHLAKNYDQYQSAQLDAQLNEWLDAHLVLDKEAGITTINDSGHYTKPDTVCVGNTNLLETNALTTDVKRIVTWAFISWNVERNTN